MITQWIIGGSQLARLDGGNDLLDLESIFRLAKLAKGKIGIGVKQRAEVIEKNIIEARRLGLPEIAIYEDPRQLCLDLREGRLCAAVRGTLSSSELLAAMKEIYNVDRVLRVALLSTAEGKPFFLAPVGIDEGNSFDERFELMMQGTKYLKCLGVKPIIAVLSKGRAEDGPRGESISRSLAEGDRLVEKARELGLEAHHRHILIEQAVNEADFIIAPDGVSGNLIFRTLYFLGGGSAIGAPVVNIGRVFIDTSRDKRSYTDSLAFAAALCAARESKK